MMAGQSKQQAMAPKQALPVAPSLPQPPVARRGHQRCRVDSCGIVRADGFLLDGTKRDTWRLGDVGEFAESDIASLPDGELTPLG